MALLVKSEVRSTGHGHTTKRRRLRPYFRRISRIHHNSRNLNAFSGYATFSGLNMPVICSHTPETGHVLAGSCVLGPGFQGCRHCPFIAPKHRHGAQPFTNIEISMTGEFLGCFQFAKHIQNVRPPPIGFLRHVLKSPYIPLMTLEYSPINMSLDSESHDHDLFAKLHMYQT